MFFTLTVTKPSAASLGAVGGCVYYDADSRSFSAIDFTPAPMRAAPGGRPLVAPPAAVRGMAALHARYGILPWAETVGPAEALARFGHAVSRSLAEDIARAADELAQDSGMRAVFGRPGGGFVQEGDQIEQLELAAALSQIRQRGAGAIFAGPLANAYAEGVAAIGGDLDIARLRAYTPRALEPILRRAGDHRIAFLPTLTSNGPQQARLWRILVEGNALSRAARDVRLHAISEASVLAHAEFARLAYAPGADLDAFDDAAVDRLDSRWDAFDPARARALGDWLEGTQPAPSEVSGASLVAMDRNGGAAACGFTLYRNFGAGRMLPGVGAPPALLAPPGVVSGALGPVVVGNTNTSNVFLAAGGSGAGASTAVVVVAAQALVGNETINAAVGSPRFSRGGGARTIFVEADVGQDARAALQARGYELQESPPIARVNAAFCPKGLPRDQDACDIRTDWRGNGLASSAQ